MNYFYIISSIISLIIIPEFLYVIYFGYKSQSWPITEGKVTVSDLKSDGEGLKHQLKYEYSVNGNEYIGKRKKFIGLIEFRSGNVRSAALKDNEKYPVDSTVEVYYDSNKPSRSTLITGSPWIKKFGLLIILLFDFYLIVTL